MVLSASLDQLVLKNKFFPCRSLLKAPVKLSSFLSHALFLMSFIENKVNPFGRDRQASGTLISDTHNRKTTETGNRCIPQTKKRHREGSE